MCVDHAMKPTETQPAAKPVSHTRGPWEMGELHHNVTERLIGWWFKSKGSGLDIGAVHLTASQDKDVQEANARLIIAAPNMADALYYLGGGSVYLEEHGRLCFCARHGKGDDSKHATSCVDAYKAWQFAGSPIPSGEQPAAPQ